MVIDGIHGAPYIPAPWIRHGICKQHLLGSPREFLQYALEICHLAIVAFVIFVRGWGHKIHGKKS